MNLKNELESVDLEKRSRALDARESVIAKKESLLDRRLIEAETLDKQIIANKETLSGIQKQLIEIRNVYESNSLVFKSKNDAINNKTRLKQEEYDQKVQRLIEIDEKLKDARKQLSDIKSDIASQSNYRDEQQRIVQHTIEQWNIDLREFQHELENVQNERTKISSDIIMLEQDRSALTSEISNLNKKFIALDESYSSKVAQLRDELQVVKDKISAAKSKLSSLEQEHLTKIDAIRAREKSLSIQEQAQMVKQQELDQKERRLQMNYGIAGLSYD